MAADAEKLDAKGIEGTLKDLNLSKEVRNKAAGLRSRFLGRGGMDSTLARTYLYVCILHLPHGHGLQRLGPGCHCACL